jgi:hypothetical protein
MEAVRHEGEKTVKSNVWLIVADGRSDEREYEGILTPGYSILVLDTNILLSFLSMVTALIESPHWTVVCHERRHARDPKR